MKDVIQALILVIFGVIIFTLGAITHEGDLTRQCSQRGYMNPFFGPNFNCQVLEDEQ